MSADIKPNRYKSEIHRKRNEKQNVPEQGIGIIFCLKCIMIIVFVSVLSLAAIFSYDFITQSTFFNIKTIEIQGTQRVKKQDILNMAELKGDENIFKVNAFTLEKQICAHPWIAAASVNRKLFSKLNISITEQHPLAIVKIEKLADILINKEGRPFKEYNPRQDHIENLPMISGLNLAHKNNQHQFYGPLFNSVLDFLKTQKYTKANKIHGDLNTGITIEVRDTYNSETAKMNATIKIKLGFGNFKAKLDRAEYICTYIDKHFPDRTISAIDICNLEKVFIKTKPNKAMHNNLEKGV